MKCDEKHPVCGNCARRFPDLESCDYDGFITSSSTQNFQGISLQSPSIQIRSESNNTSIPRVLELRLLHHYTTITSAQMPSGQNKIWNEDLPRLGFQSGQVLDAILGISAQHLWALLPRERSLAHASRYYLDRAIRQHKEALARADRRSAEGLLAAAILITHHVWTAAHSECVGGGDYSLPLQTYYMARGIMALSDQLFPWLKGSGYLWYVEQNIDVPSNEARQGQYWRDGKLDLDIMTAHVERADLSPRDIDIYLSAIRDLDAMHVAIKAGLPQPYLQRIVATMPVRLPIRFLKLVEEKKPLALALLARNLALLKVIDTIWWLHGAGGHQVVEPSVHGICKLLPTDWKWATEWPLKVISGEITIKD